MSRKMIVVPGISSTGAVPDAKEAIPPPLPEYVPEAAGRFSPGSAHVDEIRSYGDGNVNDTFLVTSASARFILQRINTRVFRRPHLVMRNMRILTEHVADRLRTAPLAGRRWEMTRIIPSREGEDHWIDPAGSFWRAISFIDNARSYDTVDDPVRAEEVGFALGFFHSLLSDLPAETLGDTLEGFHVTPLYLRRYEEIAAGRHFLRDSGAEYCARFIRARRDDASVLEDCLARGVLRLRTIHGDPKANNVLIDPDTGRAVSIIDLDTVKPGLVHYDIGDCLRSCCNPTGEDIENIEEVRFDLGLAGSVLRGYFDRARDFLTASDRELIYDAVRLITFELGLRFFTDYLEGNVYFKVKYPEHNLVRAIVQFRLAESIEARERELRALVRDLS
ncbi:MAG: aminoglycoside phosphotransferase family protein [Desulfobacteraceae bacterium]|nr:aminoglycoside phosphotransferase family protein [Desulfobacteraceae bacterium]